MAESVNAWLLTVGNQLQIAVAEYQMYAYLISSNKTTVPLAPPYCNHIYSWENRLLPVLDLAILNEIPTTSNNNNPVVVVTYQTAPQTPILFSAIDIQAAPQKISVAGTEACGLPDSYTDKFREVVISCFSYQGQVIPILNFSLLFSGQFNELLTIGPPSKQSVQLGIA